MVKILPCVANHTPNPSGYLEWHDWAKRMSRTHKQIKCPDCGLYAIWIPKKTKVNNRAAAEIGKAMQG